MEWYQTSIKDTFQRLTTSDRGLTGDEAQKRLKEYGPNKLGEGERISRLKILIHQCTSPLIYILLVAAVVTALLHEYSLWLW
jgi:Ca2+-transporting ATPase